MKKTIVSIILMVLFVNNLSAQEKRVWNMYVGVPVGATTHKIQDPGDDLYYAPLPYRTVGLAFSMERQAMNKEKTVNLVVGYNLIYLRGTVNHDALAKQIEKGEKDYFRTVSAWYDNPEKNLNCFAAMLTLEANFPANYRLHFSLPFGLGATYSGACDKGRFGVAFSINPRASYYVTDRLGLFVSYRMLSSSVTSNSNSIEGGIVYSMMMKKSKTISKVKNAVGNTVGKVVDINIQSR